MGQSANETHFLFKAKFYDQVDGLAMGSPLAPVLASLSWGTIKRYGWNNTGIQRYHFAVATLTTHFAFSL